MGRLNDVLKHLALDAEVFYAGNLCGIHNFGDDSAYCGHLHLVKSGHLKLQSKDTTLLIDQPALIYLPKATPHQVIPQPGPPLEMVCAEISYNQGVTNPLIQAFPDCISFNLTDTNAIAQTAEWLFVEAFGELCGRQAMINRLCDLFIIQILRHVIDSDIAKVGVLAGLAHQQFSKVLTQIHAAPEKPWHLDEMASIAAMSRSKFAASFKNLIGQSPGEYLLDWRLSVAGTLLKQGKPVSIVAEQVGYESSSALTRVFKKRTGFTPLDWLRQSAYDET